MIRLAWIAMGAAVILVAWAGGYSDGRKTTQDRYKTILAEAALNQQRQNMLVASLAERDRLAKMVDCRPDPAGLEIWNRSNRGE